MRRLVTERERNKDEKEQKTAPRNESSCPNTEISAFYSLPPAHPSAPQRWLPAVPVGRASTSPPQRSKTAHSRGLTFLALPAA